MMSRQTITLRMTERQARLVYEALNAMPANDRVFVIASPMLDQLYRQLYRGAEPRFKGHRGWSAPMKGVVFRHPDGRMAKVKRTDFGFAWGSKKQRG